MPKQNFTITEAAEYLGVGVNTVRRMIRDGQLPARRFSPQVIRIRLEDLEAAGQPVENIGAYL